MSVIIRLMRQGARKQPVYTVVATHTENKRDGQPLERLGQYFPKAADPKEKLKVDVEAIEAWKTRGAKVSQTVGQLLKNAAKS